MKRYLKNTLQRPVGLSLVLGGVLAATTWSGAAHAQTWSYKEAAKPYVGTSIRVLDEITPLQETMKTLVPQFVAETGIKVDYELLSHGDVINKGQADLFSGRGYYDAVMLHGLQLGPLLSAGTLAPIDAMSANKALTNPNLDQKDFVDPAFKSLVSYGGKQYGFLTWNYNQVYWARSDLLSDAGEQAAFKAKYNYPLAPAKTLQQMMDIAEFFTREKGQTLAGQPLKNDFYGVLMEGIPGGTTFTTVWENLLNNWGGGLFDSEGRPAFDTPENVAALKFWAKLWQYAPPGQAEYSLVDVPTAMGNGIAAQSIAWSDFVLGIDKPGGAPYAGKFTYSGIPVLAGSTKPRSAGAEPSLMAMSKNSKKKEATYLFMQWLVDKNTQEKLFAAGSGGVPIRYSSFQLPAAKQASMGALYGAMKSTMEVAQAKPKLPKFFEINDALSPIVQQVGIGKLTPEAAAKAGQEKLLSICKKCTL